MSGLAVWENVYQAMEEGGGLMAHGGTVTLLLQLGLRRYSDVATCCGVWSLSNMIILLIHGSFSIWIEYAML